MTESKLKKSYFESKLIILNSEGLNTLSLLEKLSNLFNPFNLTKARYKINQRTKAFEIFGDLFLKYELAIWNETNLLLLKFNLHFT